MMENLANMPRIYPHQLRTLIEARNWIEKAHRGQKYGDDPYYTHPIAVAENIQDATVDEYLAALFHDVIEDTKYDEAALREMWDNDAAIDMVLLLTKDESLTYKENIQRIIDSGNVGAMKVKLSDNQINISGDKSKMQPERAKKLMDRYTMSIEMLTKAITDNG